ncbi:MAG: hypothetical protein M1834_008979 [Cirrosporium novae-zelandiae]|nr:MAG: hypothetical protein M1834_008979 [Cirrosporium novae-zelandiae]
MASFIPFIPSFPSYTGPYKVGSVDLEIPISDLTSPSASPDPTISTIQCRIFYPCEPVSSRSVYWLPEPQRDYVRSYMRFLGIGRWTSELLSFLSWQLYHIEIPVLENAKLLPPPAESQRWPVMVFSHGLGGTRNSYSHIVGSLASHGLVVIATEHRDGSVPITFIQDIEGNIEKPVEYKIMAHTKTKKVMDARNEQLKIRLWELGLVHSILLELDAGKPLENFALDRFSDLKLSMFKGKLGVHEPGSIIWAGHSFGAVTTVQFTKSVFWQHSKHPEIQDPNAFTYSPLFEPDAGSPLVSQITPRSPIILLDLWILPLLSPSTRWLWNRPLPNYASPAGSEGSSLMSILSEGFYKWSSNLAATKRVLSADPSLTSEKRPSDKPSPYIFYPISSAHLNQSDFGILFPWVTKRFVKADEPERILCLNVRAILQMLRQNGVAVGNTSKLEMEMEEEEEEEAGFVKIERESEKQEATQDVTILATDGKVRGWIAITLSDDENVDTEKLNQELFGEDESS